MTKITSSQWKCTRHIPTLLQTQQEDYKPGCHWANIINNPKLRKMATKCIQNNYGVQTLWNNDDKCN